MKICWIVVVITLNVSISAIQCYLAEGSLNSCSGNDGSINLIKMISAQPHFLNGNYINKKNYKAGFKRKNSTYTDLPIQWDVIKDFPEDTELIIRLVRSNSEYGPWEDIETYTSKICDLKDKYHDYLPPFLIELTKKGKCVQKGMYDFDDAGQFQFHRLLPARFLEGWYFNTYNQILAPDSNVLIKDFEIKSKSVCAK